MVATASCYFRVIVEPTVHEFTKSKSSVRHGLLAAMVLNHMADYIALENKPRLKTSESKALVDSVCNEITSVCPDFKFIREIANVAKHSKIDLKTNDPSVTSASALAITPGLFSAPFGQGRFAEACVVYAELEDGDSIPLHSAAAKVLEAWRSYLSKSDICNTQKD